MGRILLTGATGYVGGELLRELETRRLPVRCLARTPSRVRPGWPAGTEVVRGDVLDPGSLQPAFEGVETAYYLVHSMGAEGDFEEHDRAGARNFARAAAQAGARRIVYLGGLGEGSEALSPHLRSRHEVGAVLASEGVPVLELRASIVLGCGSASFEMIRALVERLPLMITPRWVGTLAQPIAMSDLVEYLLEAMSAPAVGHTIVEVGGAETECYAGLLRAYARLRGLRRAMIPVPVLTPRLSSLWLALVTPYYAAIGRDLVESLRNPTVVRDPAGASRFQARPLGVRQAMERALSDEDAEFAEGNWDELLRSRGARRTWVGFWRGTRIIERREVRVDAPPADAFRPIEAIGGSNGWYSASWLWRLRGWIDGLLGGPGSRRGRSRDRGLEPGDTIDSWRVERVEPGRRLLLRAEMRLPGRAWLDFQVHPDGEGVRIRQVAVFDARGLGGILYWCALLPFHAWIFRRMLREIARRACESART